MTNSDARVDFSVAKWDYTQRYPVPDKQLADKDDYLDPDNDDPEPPKLTAKDADANGPLTFNWNVNAEGVVELHM